jgi:hypothetical protein
MPNLDRRDGGQAAGARKGLFARWLESIAESRIRQVEHETGLHRPVGEQKRPVAQSPRQRDDTA